MYPVCGPYLGHLREAEKYEKPAGERDSKLTHDICALNP